MLFYFLDIMKSKSNPEFLKKERSNAAKQSRGLRSKVSVKFNTKCPLFTGICPKFKHTHGVNPHTFKLPLELLCIVKLSCRLHHCRSFHHTLCCAVAQDILTESLLSCKFCHLVYFVYQSVIEQASWDS